MMESKHKIAELFSRKLNALYEYDEPSDLFVKMTPNIAGMKPVVSVFVLNEGIAMVWDILDEEERKTCAAMMLSSKDEQ